MSHQVEEQETGKTEMYTPKMKPGDVEIPNRIFVKGVSKDTVEEDLIFRFEEFGKVVDCRIVLDRFGHSKGYGFITFDSQNIAEKVREMGRVKFNDVELVIGPARIKKKRSYCYMFNSAQPCYLQDGNIIFPANIPPQQVIQPTHMVSNVQMTPVMQPQLQAQQPAQQQQQQQQQPQPQQQQFHPQQQQYTGPVIFSVVNEPINVQHAHPSYVAYQASPPPLTTIMEKVDRMNISQVSTPVRSVDDQEVPNFSSQHINIDHYGGQYHRLRSGTF